MSDEHPSPAHHLADVLAQENEALRRLDFPAAVALVSAKEAALAELATSPVPPSKLGTLGQRLGSLAAENQVLLARAIEVQTRIVRIIARAGAIPPAAQRYGANGTGRHAGTGALAVSARV